MFTADLDTKTGHNGMVGGVSFFRHIVDLVNQDKMESAKRLLHEKEGELIPLLSYWGYRVVGRIRAGIVEGYDKERLLQWVHRGLYLAERLGPHGELCMVGLNKEKVGEDLAPVADMQLLDTTGQEPVPVCEENVDEAADLWKLRPFTIEPVERFWPPWSLTDTWVLRRPNMFSHERFFYACLQEAVGAGDRDAMFYLGMCYELGMGCDKSVAASAVWYKAAAEKGVPGAEIGVQRVERRGPTTDQKPNGAFAKYALR